jgi:predicted kinase
MVKWLSCQPI